MSWLEHLEVQGRFTGVPQVVFITPADLLIVLLNIQSIHAGTMCKCSYFYFERLVKKTHSSGESVQNKQPYKSIILKSNGETLPAE